jgi:hypothetical protein
MALDDRKGSKHALARTGAGQVGHSVVSATIRLTFKGGLPAIVEILG